MRITRTLLLLLCTVVIAYSAHAQEQTVSGTVSDAETGETIPGVNVVVAGTNLGTTTAGDGSYILDVPAAADTLVFSFVGYQQLRVGIDGRSQIDVSLQPTIAELGDLVVTAFGVERQQRELGYSVQQVGGDDLANTQQNNIVNALSGQIAGVQITNTGGAPGRSSRIIIRGLTSLNPNADNQPLFVVDGVPIDNSTIESDGTPRGMSNRAADINPNDIESVNVLKGSAATALYGVRAANGAVIITTKQGREGSMQVNISSTAGAERVNRYPDFQTVYGQGFGFEHDPESFWPNWGAPIAEVADTVSGWEYHDIWRDAMQTGTEFDNTVSVSGGSDGTTYYASLSHLRQEGVVPFGDWTRSSGRLAGSINPFDNLSISSSVNYVNSGGNRVPADRFMERLMYWAPNKDVTNFEKDDGTMRGYYGNQSSGTNPLYDAKYATYEDDVNRIVGNISLEYQPLSWLDMSYRIGSDYYHDQRSNILPGPRGVANENVLSSTGFITEDRISSRDINSTLTFTANQEITDRFTSRLTVGNDIFERHRNRITASGNNFVTPEFYHLSNVRDLSTGQNLTTSRLIGLYGDLSLEYDGYLFVNLTGRNDWSSTLPAENRSFFYPSVNVSFLADQLFELPEVFSYAQLRGSFAQVGKDADPYLTSTTYNTPSTYPLDGRVGFTRSQILGASDLKPELTTTLEIGSDVRFLEDRFGIDVTLYQSNSADQILQVPVSNATGYTRVVMNAGEIENRGIELQLNAIPIQTPDLNWDVTLNFSSNRNTVVDIREGIEEIVIGSQFGYAGSGPTIKLIEGEAYGNIYGQSYERYYPEGEEPADPRFLEEDRPLLIGEDGFPVINSEQKILGNSQPDWTGGLSSTLAYRGLSFSFLIDAVQGLDVFSQYDNFFTAFGITENTLDREDTVVFDGFTADGERNTQEVWLGQGVGPDGVDYGAGYHRNVKRAATEEFVKDASFVKLRNVRLAWSLPQRWLQNVNVQTVTVAGTVNNIILFTPFDGFDPESRSGGAGSNADGFTGLDYPGVARFLFSLNVTL